MGKRLLLERSVTGIEHYVEVDNDGDAITLIEHTPGHVEDAILDSCAQLRSLHQRKGAQLQHAARTPLNTWQAWRREWRQHWRDKYTWPQFEVMKLNSRDNCRLRTGNGSGVFGKRL